MKKIFPLFLVLTLSFCKAPEVEQEKITYTHPIPFEPQSYLCYRAITPPTIDGKLLQESWEQSDSTNDFVDIRGSQVPDPPLRTRAKMLWDSSYFYIAAELEEPHIWATLEERDAIMYHDDDFEVFIDPDGDGHNYYEFEMNAYNAIWDLLMLRPYRTDTLPNYLMNWEIKGIKTAVSIQGTLNNPGDEDTGWLVELAFPWSALMELAPERRMPESGEQWRVNFSRVDWHMDIENGAYRKVLDASGEKPLPEENWVWSPTGYVNMHLPEAWGFVQFIGKEVGTGQDSFLMPADEKIKWALWQMYYEQKEFRKKKGYWAYNIDVLGIPEVDIPDYVFNPVLVAGQGTFELSVNAIDGTYIWVLDSDSQIRKMKR